MGYPDFEKLREEENVARGAYDAGFESGRKHERAEIGLSFPDHTKGVLDTLKLSGDGFVDLAHFSFGLGEEAGEVLGKLKRACREDRGVITDARKEQVLAEIGDVLWYAAALSHLLGSSLEQVAKDNLAKLQSRKERGVLMGEGDRR